MSEGLECEVSRYCKSNKIHSLYLYLLQGYKVENIITNYDPHLA